VGVNEGHVEVDMGGEGDNEDNGIEESVYEPNVQKENDVEEFDVSGWDESIGNSLNEDELIDVSIHNEEGQDDS